MVRSYDMVATLHDV